MDHGYWRIFGSVQNTLSESRLSLPGQSFVVIQSCGGILEHKIGKNLLILPARGDIKRFSFCVSLHNQPTYRGKCQSENRVMKKMDEKLFALTFLFGNLFSNGQKYHSCPTRKLLKNAKIKF